MKKQFLIVFLSVIFVSYNYAQKNLDSLSHCFKCGNKIKIGNFKYPTVKIGDQCWISMNLYVGSCSNSISDNNIPERYCYDNSSANCEFFGGLYNWHEMMNYSNNEGGIGICPTGWHVPSMDDWNILLNDQGGNSIAGKTLKAKGQARWGKDNTANNKSGFGAIGGGAFSVWSAFNYVKEKGYYWTSTSNVGNTAFFVDFSSNTDHVSFYGEGDKNGSFYSVRCVKD